MLKASVVIVPDGRDPAFQEISGDTMLLMAPGVFYHARLDTIFIVRSQLTDGEWIVHSK